MKLGKKVYGTNGLNIILKRNKNGFHKNPSRPLIFGFFAVAFSSFPLTAAAQSNVQLNRSFVLENTINQYGPGAPISESYFLGTAGASWGSYNSGSAPLSYGVNAITGSRITTPAIPGTPAIYVPGVPGVTIPGGCVPYIGCFPSTTTPGTPGFTIPGIPGIPAVTTDTRSGFAINVASSGKVGAEIRTQVTPGSITASIPVDTRLDINGTVGSGLFKVKANGMLSPGASLTATAPGMNFGIDGVINLKNSIGGTGCIIGAGCSSSTSDVNITPGKFTLVGVDTSQKNGLTLAGTNIPISTNTGSYTIRKDQVPCKTSECANIPISVSGPALATASYALPQTLTSTSLTGSKFDTLALTRKDMVIKTNADLTGIAQTVLGSPIDALSPNISVKVPQIPFAIGSVTGTSINTQIGLDLGLSQFFTLGGVSTENMTVTLNFEKSVSLVKNSDFVTCSPSGICAPTVPPEFLQLGKTVTLNLDDEITLFGGGSLISYSYGFKNPSSLTSETAIDVGFNVPIKAACYKVSVPGFSTDDCAYEYIRNYDLTSIPVFEDTFSFDFGRKTFLIPIAVDFQSPDAEPAVGAVPEPSTILLFGLAMLGMGVSLQRRSKAGFQT